MFSGGRKAILAFLIVSFLGYSFYLYARLPVAERSITNEIRLGKMKWQELNCNACHQVYGLGGYLGPDLTNSFSLRGKDYIKAFLKNGTTTMPDFQLSEQEIDVLVAFLKDIDASGKAAPTSFIREYNGTIRQ